MDFFETKNSLKMEPLASRLRPRHLGEFIGQEHILSQGCLLRRAIELDQLSSLIFFGPPGTGKTTLARVIANTTKAHFLAINAVLSGVKEIRQCIEIAENKKKLESKRTVLFIDEVHRFNKSQQDALLPHVENGTLILIGATTENPYFEINKALISRSRVFELKSLTDEHLSKLLDLVFTDNERGYGSKKVLLHDKARKHLVKMASGDARSLLNAIELAVETTPKKKSDEIVIDLEVAADSIQQRAVLYDKDGDAHYDTISAFIKSIRGSDPDAALYWMAKMVKAGEDPRYIFRRMIILASEDIGLANPQAINVVMSCAQAYDYIGLPEGQYPLSQACIYLATSPKSNTTMAYFDAVRDIHEELEGEVPNPLKDGSRDKEGLGHGEGYLYPHDYKSHWVKQQYLPDHLQGKYYYHPGELGYEGKIKEAVLNKRK